MPNNRQQHQEIYLKPGELHIAGRPTLVKTTLGSCVSVIFHSRRAGIGAICHAQLPEKNGLKQKCYECCPVRCLDDAPDSCDFKYITCSIKYMLGRFQKMGIKKNEIEVKLFGGAKILREKKQLFSIGDKNIAKATTMLQDLRLNITEQQVGGNAGMALRFYTDTGEIKYRVNR